eukprot:3174662-Prymnesium_polylepis.1
MVVSSSLYVVAAQRCFIRTAELRTAVLKLSKPMLTVRLTLLTLAAVGSVFGIHKDGHLRWYVIGPIAMMGAVGMTAIDRLEQVHKLDPQRMEQSLVASLARSHCSTCKEPARGVTSALGSRWCVTAAAVIAL